MIIIDAPQPATMTDYQAALSSMTERLKTIPSLISVYQIGGFGAPGISDIDMVAVFKDDASVTQDPQSYLTGIARYLFAHQLFGTSESYFKKSQLYTSFHNYKLLHGKELRSPAPLNDTQTHEMMQHQLGYEFLIRMWINMIVERGYGVYKLRNLLLQGNGLAYDLEFLNANPEKFSRCLDTIMNWRATWFKKKPSQAEIASLYENLYQELTSFLQKRLEMHPIYLPQRDTYVLGRNIFLEKSDHLKHAKSGFTVPYMPKAIARKVLSLQSRTTKFTASFPFSNVNVPEHIAHSFDYAHSAWTYNRKKLPFFMPLTSSLVLQP